VTWLETAPILIKLDEWETQRKPYPLAQEEQRVFFGLLPEHLSRMALFKINTECRAHDVRRFGDERLFKPERSLRARLCGSAHGCLYVQGSKRTIERYPSLADCMGRALRFAVDRAASINKSARCFRLTDGKSKVNSSKPVRNDLEQIPIQFDMRGDVASYCNERLFPRNELSFSRWSK